MTSLKDQCISISEFKKNTNKYIKEAEEKPIYIFANNKLVGQFTHANMIANIEYKLDITFTPPKKLQNF